MHENKIVVKAIGSNYDIENSFMLNYSNLEYYSEYGMLPIKNSYEHITINLLELFKEGKIIVFSMFKFNSIYIYI